MRYIRYAFLAILAVVLVSVALANRQIVTLQLLPEGLARIAGQNPTIDLPLFLIIFAGILAGLLIGFIWEWLREHKHRAEVNRKQKEVGKLEREVKRLKGEKHQGKDEVLALLDN
ncbi:LapA family protein [Pseudooceanicola sp. 502str34]|uniref:LapA family protein n=1 Tax=Maritimibacter alkaliphilus TaxID=404236 RepID=UPI001C9684C8|nr:LapA family protein [Maritimibacter alkaliphilus]MBY6091154.1 LapA family protein [Maritimibacter alkaliphilus]